MRTEVSVRLTISFPGAARTGLGLYSFCRNARVGDGWHGLPGLPIRCKLGGVKEIKFIIEPCDEMGGFVARWNDVPGKGGITTQGDSFAELDAMIADAVNGYFEPGERPERVRLHFAQDPIVAVK